MVAASPWPARSTLATRRLHARTRELPEARPAGYPRPVSTSDDTATSRTDDPDTDSWDDCASGWDGDTVTRAYADAAFASLRGLLTRLGRGLEGAVVCDFGCGTGLLTERMLPHCAAVDAVDTSKAMLEVLRAKVDTHAWSQVRTFAALPPPERSYDLVVCSSVCAFLQDYPGTVRELANRLKPGGVFVQWDWEADPDKPEDGGLDRPTIRACLAAAGLCSVVVEEAFRVSIEGATMRPLLGAGIAPPAVPGADAGG